MLKLIWRIIQLVILGIVLVMITYFIPDRDVVRIVGNDIVRLDPGEGSPFWDPTRANPDAGNTVDTYFINTVKRNGKERVYRNVDAILYFKFDSSNLNAKAQDWGDENEDVWAVVHHYGWRVTIFTWYPNAYKMSRVSGPEHRLFPWFKIVFFILFFGVLFWMWRIWRKFKKERLDPIGAKIGAAGDKIEYEAKEAGGAISGFFRKIFGSGKKG